MPDEVANCDERLESNLSFELTSMRKRHHRASAF